MNADGNDATSSIVMKREADGQSPAKRVKCGPEATAETTISTQVTCLL